MKLINKILKWKGTKLVFLMGKGKDKNADLIFNLINDFIKVKRIKKPLIGFKKLSVLSNDVLILSNNDFSTERIESFFSLFGEVLVVINSANLEKEKKIITLLDKSGELLIDFESIGKVPGKRIKKRLSYGFQKNADFYISDLNLSDRVNFKVNHKGSSIPIWIKDKNGKETVLFNTLALGVGTMLNLNFVKLAQKISD